jgi:hypothetical protein
MGQAPLGMAKLGALARTYEWGALEKSTGGWHDIEAF